MANSLGPKEMFMEYRKNNPGTDVTYTLYKEVISMYNKKLVDVLLTGKEYNLRHNLGRIRIRKVQRNFEKPTINWGETNKLKAEGINQFVYFTDDHWFRWYWEKRKCSIKNKSVYQFRPTEGKTGNKRKLITLLQDDEFAYLNFTE
jgi:hypothetical protein